MGNPAPPARARVFPGLRRTLAGISTADFAASVELVEAPAQRRPGRRRRRAIAAATSGVGGGRLASFTSGSGTFADDPGPPSVAPGSSPEHPPLLALPLADEEFTRPLDRSDGSRGTSRAYRASGSKPCRAASQIAARIQTRSPTVMPIATAPGLSKMAESEDRAEQRAHDRARDDRLPPLCRSPAPPRARRGPGRPRR